MVRCGVQEEDVSKRDGFEHLGHDIQVRACHAMPCRGVGEEGRRKEAIRRVHASSFKGAPKKSLSTQRPAPAPRMPSLQLLLAAANDMIKNPLAVAFHRTPIAPLLSAVRCLPAERGLC